LKWDDIDFANDRFTVHASKTEHHANGGIRTVPMFPELKPLFQDVFDEAKVGDVYCIIQYRDKAVNLRTQMNKIIKRAGLEIWPKTFQNLRSSRETELFKLTRGNIKAVCKWIGNSPEVAMIHYAQITEADMKEATKMTILNAAEKEVHDPVHTGADSPCTELNESEIDTDITSDENKRLQKKTSARNSVRIAGQWAGLDSNQRRLAPTGLQPVPFSHSGTDPHQEHQFTRLAINFN